MATVSDQSDDPCGRARRAHAAPHGHGPSRCSGGRQGADRCATENLVRAGFTRIVINHAHLGAMIEERVGDGTLLDFLSTTRARDRRSTPREASRLRSHSSGRRHSLSLTVTFTASSPSRACGGGRSEDERRDCASRARRQSAPPSRGDFALVDERVRNDGSARLTFSGIGLYNPELFLGLTARREGAARPLLRRAAMPAR